MELFSPMAEIVAAGNVFDIAAGETIIRGSHEIDEVRDFALAAAAGLASHPRKLESRFLYDARGSRLFDLITQQPEYYLTRIETDLLATHAAKIRALTGPATLVELGSGNSIKTEHLLKAWLAHESLVGYVAVDVSESALREASRGISAAHPGVRVIGINSDYKSSFPLLSALSPVLALFLGSSIGNFSPSETTSFLQGVSTALTPGDFFLVGIDLVKEKSVIEAAYNDAAGVTQEFTRNLFVRMNRELGSGIDLSAVHHEAVYNPVKEQVEIQARFTRQQTIRIEPLNERFTLSSGEAIQTEISRKFNVDRFVSLAGRLDLAVEEVFTDQQNWFALVLLRRREIKVSKGGN
ncbi:L-histidine N(alpha)-methyltransferase [Pelotalea chapellei]|uniref:L-histidine N(Alpha)-methyltransferase n=1 Tax=Pelotalea chapellei TaxID=44671 RepID=A0ABS5UCQ2_9BACT|nr:L-histidine N(alpha)-methyltransferase [Pelotalea chapellei]MBT1073423.1 L-histidine N(alpha)-methyltransferase [Pelotalea chapellei]